MSTDADSASGRKMACTSDSSLARLGVSMHELTSSGDREPIAGTLWHRCVLAQLQRISTPVETAQELA